MDGASEIRRRHEASLAATVGSFAQSVVYRSTRDHVCPICGGAKKDGYAWCCNYFLILSHSAPFVVYWMP